MNENFDILPEQAADHYEKYLFNINDRLNELMQYTNEITYSFEGHDSNDFTRKIQNSTKALAEQVQGIADGVADITHQMLQVLEEKNETVRSQVQEEYIDQLHLAAERLSELESYREVELDGRKAFGEEDKEMLGNAFVDLTEKWEEAIRQMQSEARELDEESEQSELSGVYAEISDLFDQYLNQLGEQIEVIGSHTQEIEDAHKERKAVMNQTSAERAGEFLADLNRSLEDAASDFKGFTF